jgi:hypothetical protein
MSQRGLALAFLQGPPLGALSTLPLGPHPTCSRALMAVITSGAAATASSAAPVRPTMGCRSRGSTPTAAMVRIAGMLRRSEGRGVWGWWCGWLWGIGLGPHPTGTAECYQGLKQAGARAGALHAHFSIRVGRHDAACRGPVHRPDRHRLVARDARLRGKHARSVSGQLLLQGRGRRVSGGGGWGPRRGTHLVWPGMGLRVWGALQRVGAPPSRQALTSLPSAGRRMHSRPAMGAAATAAQPGPVMTTFLSKAPAPSPYDAIRTDRWGSPSR